MLTRERRGAIEHLRAQLPAAVRREEAWIVGGAVRDCLMNRESLDVDLTSRDAQRLATELARSLSGRAVAIGTDPITWRVVSGSRSFDVAPLQGVDITADLMRRDFTINAIAIPVLGDLTLVDPVCGADDAAGRILRMVRPSNFDDDPLRILRGVRFAVTLGLTFEDETAREMRARGGTIRQAAPERIRYELERMLEHDSALSIRLLRSLELAADVLRIETGDDVEQALERAGSGAIALSLSIIYASIGSEDARELLRSERWRARTALHVSSILRSAKFDWHDPVVRVTDLYELGLELSEQLSRFLAATKREHEAAVLDQFLSGRDPQWWSATPLLGGKEIAALTGVEGAALGRASRALLEAQLRGAVLTREQAERFVQVFSQSAGD